jgi:probable HAF family extracellular repeat protein
MIRLQNCVLATTVAISIVICHAARATVAYSVTDLGPGYPSLYSRVPLDLGTGWSLLGNGINASGHVAGTATRFNSTSAFLYDGSFHLLGSLGGTYSEGNGINDSDWVTGQSGTAVVGQSRAFLYDGTMHDLGTLGGTSSAGVGINATGQVTGYSYTTADAGLHAFLYDGTMHDLGTLGGRISLARGINSHGDVAGTAFLDDFTYHAFLFTSGGGMMDLNSLVDPASGWDFMDAWEIQNNGQIIGYGTLGDDTHTFLLSPIPEPATWALAVCALLALGIRRLFSRRFK